LPRKVLKACLLLRSLSVEVLITKGSAFGEFLDLLDEVAVVSTKLKLTEHDIALSELRKSEPSDFSDTLYGFVA
jgi:hypothetical protein